MKNFSLKQLTFSIIGLILCGVGVSFFLLSNLGVDPNSVFVTGIANQLNVTYGWSSLMINGFILLIVWFTDKNYVNISSVLAIFLIGFSVDISMNIFDYIFTEPITNQFFRYLLLLLGIFILCIGVVMYVAQDLGIAAFDSISEIISQKRNLEFKYVRIAIDSSLLLIGWLLGGTVGIGTLIIALLTGPTINAIRKIAKIN